MKMGCSASGWHELPEKAEQKKMECNAKKRLTERKMINGGKESNGIWLWIVGMDIFIKNYSCSFRTNAMTANVKQVNILRKFYLIWKSFCQCLRFSKRSVSERGINEKWCNIIAHKSLFYSKAVLFYQFLRSTYYATTSNVSIAQKNTLTVLEILVKIIQMPIKKYSSIFNNRRQTMASNILLSQILAYLKT